MSETPEISFQTVIDALLDEETPFNPGYLYRLSDLDSEELNQFIHTWSRLPLWRRKALLEDLEELGSPMKAITHLSHPGPERLGAGCSWT